MCCRCGTTCRRVTTALCVLIALSLNLHYLLLFPYAGFVALLAEALLSSRVLMTTVNTLWVSNVHNGMLEGGIPAPNRTVSYGSKPSNLLDVYDFAGRVRKKRPAVLYLHAGAFTTGGREFGAGTMSWLAAHGYVAISAQYSLTVSTDGDGVAGCTVHHVVEELDSGAILKQAEVPAFLGDTPESLHERIQEQEHRIFSESITEVWDGMRGEA